MDFADAAFLGVMAIIVVAVMRGGRWNPDTRRWERNSPQNPYNRGKTATTERQRTRLYGKAEHARTAASEQAELQALRAEVQSLRARLQAMEAGSREQGAVNPETLRAQEAASKALGDKPGL